MRKENFKDGIRTNKVSLNLTVALSVQEKVLNAAYN